MADETRKDRSPGEAARGPQDTLAPAGGAPAGGARADDAIDRAADEEVQSSGTGAAEPDGAAFPNPGGGAVLAPADDDAGDPATDPTTGHPDEGLGAGDALRGGGAGGPLPPGTGRPLPDPDADP